MLPAARIRQAAAALRAVDRLDKLCLIAFLLAQGWAAASVVLVPILIESHPVALEVLTAGVPSMVGAGAFVHAGRADLVSSMCAPLLFWPLIDLASWWLGVRFGPRVVSRLVVHRPRIRQFEIRAEGVLDRRGLWAVALAPYVPVPTAVIYAAAGWRRISLARFVFAYVAGMVTRCAIAVALGYAYQSSAVRASRAAGRVGVRVLLGLLILALTAWLIHNGLRWLRPAARGFDRAKESALGTDGCDVGPEREQM